MRILLTSTFILLFGISIGYAQRYSPDRPGIGNGSFVTPQNMLGVEAGIELVTNDFSDQYNFGQVLLRYGLVKNLELRAALNSYSYVKVESSFYSYSFDGFNDMDIGAKYNIAQANENQPNLSILGEVSLPVGSDNFTSDAAIPRIYLLLDQSINDNWGISSNVGYSFEGGYHSDYWLFTLSSGFTVPSNENFGGYFGFAGEFFPDGGNNFWLDAGLTYQLKNNSQLDLNSGYGAQWEVFFIGAGYAQGFN